MADDAPGPAQIRALRGSLSRARFAELLGVTAHTVYRWELEPDAPQARRPTGASLEALQRFAARAAAPAPPPVPAELVDAIDALHRCEWDRAERALLAVGSRELTVADRGAALAAQAQLQLWRFNDPRAALALLSPALAQPACPTAVHVAAAHVFGAPDGSVFDAGRAINHVRAIEAALIAEPSPDATIAARLADIGVALYLGDPALLGRAFARGAAALDGAVQPLHALLVAELRGHQAVIEGQPALAARRFDEVARDAAARGWKLARARALAFTALQRLLALEPPARVIELACESDALTASERIRAGFHSLVAGHAHAEALLRLARFDDAERVLGRAFAVAQDCAWPIHNIVLPIVRLHVYRGGAQAVDGVIDKLAPDSSYRVFAEAARDELRGDLRAAADRYARAIAIARAAGGFPYLLREAVIARAAALLAAGTPAEATSALDDADRLHERFPSAWTIAIVRRLRGVALASAGRLDEARALLEASIATFEGGEDAPQAALSRRALVLASNPAASAAAGDELARLRVAAPAYLTAGQRPRGATAPSPAATMSSPSPPALGLAAIPPAAIERVSLRGAPAALIRSELARVLGELLGVAFRASPEPARGENLVTTDAALDPAQRAVVRALAAVADLALDVAMLRGLATAPPEPRPSGAFVASSPAMRRLHADAARVAASRATVLVGGESGSGKEVVARLVHELSPRAAGPFVAVNCAALPRELFEGQLFGSKKGAFTGAIADQPGLIRSAAGGTLFLDEIGELPLELQPKLLRFLDVGEVQPVGGSAHQVDVRIVAATHRDLEELVRARSFREDLFYRLQVVVLRVSPLRERPEDIVALARHFLARHAGDSEPHLLAPDAIAALLAHDWPGNVRELRNVIERSLAFGAPRVLGAADLRID